MREARQVAGRERAKRERRRRARRAPVQRDAAEPQQQSRPSKDDLARERLEPLEQGERPRVVTVGAVIATAMAVSTVVLFAAGVEVQGSDARTPGTIVYASLTGAMAAGMWLSRYWAVLGFQTLLAFAIVIWSLLLIKAESALGALLALAVIAAAGTMFCFLVKAMARIQMPERRPPA
ncbi:MAG: hypothetical protein ACRDLQ_01165 [Solirubrobacterales bacterium]